MRIITIFLSVIILHGKINIRFIYFKTEGGEEKVVVTTVQSSMIDDSVPKKLPEMVRWRWMTVKVADAVRVRRWFHE